MSCEKEEAIWKSAQPPDGELPGALPQPCGV